MVPPKNESNPHRPEGKDGINRRTVVGAAAWAAPAIALSVASPAAATSLGTITASPNAITAGFPKSTELQLSPAADGVTISISAEPEGIVMFPADVISLPGGSASVLFSTTETAAQVVMITAVAPGYQPLSFPLTVEAAPAITLVDAPEYATFDKSAKTVYPLEFALSPAASGVPITLTRESGPNKGMVGMATYNLVSDGSGRAKTTVGATENVADAVIVRAAAPGYQTLEFVINTLKEGSTEPGGGSGVGKTHVASLVDVMNKAAHGITQVGPYEFTIKEALTASAAYTPVNLTITPREGTPADIKSATIKSSSYSKYAIVEDTAQASEGSITKMDLSLVRAGAPKGTTYWIGFGAGATYPDDFRLTFTVV